MIQIKAQDLERPDISDMPKHPLARDVVVVIAIKLVVVIAAAVFVFGPAERPRIDAGSIATRLIGTPDASPQSRNTVP